MAEGNSRDSDAVKNGEQNLDATYRIGDLAEEFNVTLRTLRFYEDKALLNPQRQGTTRLYSSQDRERLKVILFSKKVGFSLLEIHSILQAYDSGMGSRNSLASSRLRFQDRLIVLKEQKGEIENAISELTEQLTSENGRFAK